MLNGNNESAEWIFDSYLYIILVICHMLVAYTSTYCTYPLYLCRILWINYNSNEDLFFSKIKFLHFRHRLKPTTSVGSCRSTKLNQ